MYKAECDRHLDGVPPSALSRMLGDSGGAPPRAVSSSLHARTHTNKQSGWGGWGVTELSLTEGCRNKLCVWRVKLEPELFDELDEVGLIERGELNVP